MKDKNSLPQAQPSGDVQDMPGQEGRTYPLCWQPQVLVCGNVFMRSETAPAFASQGSLYREGILDLSPVIRLESLTLKAGVGVVVVVCVYLSTG